MTDTLVRRLLYVAGLWNIVGGISALADPASHFGQMYRGTLSMGDPIQAFFFQATWINVIAWGAGYLRAARTPPERPTILIAGGAGKLAYFGACAALFASGLGTAALLVTGLLDVAFAAFFAFVVLRGQTRARMAHATVGSAL